MSSKEPVLTSWFFYAQSKKHDSYKFLYCCKRIIMKEQLIKLAFNKIFPKAKKTKVGGFFSGIVNGITASTPLGVAPEFIKTLFDTNKDGVINAHDFKGMQPKTFGFLIGVGIVVTLATYFLSKA